MGGEVLVWIQIQGGKLPRWLDGLLATGQSLAKALQGKLSLLVLAGEDAQEEIAGLARSGVERIIAAQGPTLGSYRGDAFRTILQEVVGREKPAVLLSAATPVAGDLFARLAAALPCWLVPHCTELKSKGPDRLSVSRLVLGGQMETQRELPLDRPLLATLRPEFLPRVSQPPPAEVPVERLAIAPGPPSETVRQERPIAGEAASLAEAEVVVAGGAGAGDQEGFALVARLAAALGGALAGSAVAVERGWLPHGRQIGRSGLTVFPELFLACGISGSIHFTAGMQGSRQIVAINSDPAAPIFRLADLAIVGDLRQVIPALINRLAQGEVLVRS